MDDVAELCADLETIWRETIPLAAAMGLTVASYREGELAVRAPLAPNRNLHGTGFAGSLFSIAVLTAWGRVWLALRAGGLDGRIVVADSRIDYRKAVTAEIRCRCRLAETAASAARETLATTGRATLPLECTIGEPDAPAVEFAGTYVVLRKR